MLQRGGSHSDCTERRAFRIKGWLWRKGFLRFLQQSHCSLMVKHQSNAFIVWWEASFHTDLLCDTDFLFFIHARTLHISQISGSNNRLIYFFFILLLIKTCTARLLEMSSLTGAALAARVQFCALYERKKNNRPRRRHRRESENESRSVRKNKRNEKMRYVRNDAVSHVKLKRQALMGDKTG